MTPAKELTTAGLLFMVVSLASVLTLVVCCYRRVLSTERRPEEPPAGDAPDAES